VSRYSASFRSFPLQFKKPAGTSRGYLNTKPSWILSIIDNEKQIEGFGECSIIPGLSIDKIDDIEPELQVVCDRINSSKDLQIPENQLDNFPAIKFAFETAAHDLKGGGKRKLFDNSFSRGEKGIQINGLIWMGDADDMYLQAKQKIESGFNCIKFKIGALDFEKELELIRRVRTDFGSEIEIRLDANGAFLHQEALLKIDKLSEFNIHSIEQPIKPGKWSSMAKICKESPIPIALDEELIGVIGPDQQIALLQEIKPDYIILKPSLLGGLSKSDEWIKIAEENNIGWWATSALESNLGLNAIAQWVANKNTIMPQGLGTGSLYIQNYPLNLEIKMGQLWFKG